MNVTLYLFLCEHPYLYFLFLSVYSNIALTVMWILLEKKGYPVYMYDRLGYFLMVEWFIYDIAFVSGILHPLLNITSLTVAVYSFYFILCFFKEKKK